MQHVARKAPFAAVLIVSTIACSSAPKSLAPGDHFFRTVVAGSGSSSGGTANIVLYDPAHAADRTPGSPGTAPGSHDVVGKYFPTTGATIILSGTYDYAGSFIASGNGWTFSGTADGTSARGSVTGPGGTTETFGGEDVAAGTVNAFCGTYDGGDSGSWNFVVSTSGEVTGAFAGSTSGTLFGTASGDSITLNWSATYGENASGSASGTVDSSGSVSGTWSGSVGSSHVQGTWQSTSNCGGDEPTYSPSPSCTCETVNGNGCCPGGVCCSI